MAIVSISEAARLTGKARSTIQSYIKTGKLSKTATTIGGKGIDISELIRVFGEFQTTGTTCSETVAISQQTTSNTTELAVLKKENEMLKQLLEETHKHNDSLRQAMLMLENKEKTPAPDPAPVTVKKPWWKVFS